LFTDAPALLATWKQYVQSDDKVKRHRDGGRWKEAWKVIAKGIVSTHNGDLHTALCTVVKPSQNHLLQYGERTVNECATAHLMEHQARTVLNIHDGMASFLRDLQENAERWMFVGQQTMLGLGLSDYDQKQYHQHILTVVQTYVDRERMFSFYGSLKPEIQTFIEDELHQAGQHLLLPKNGSEVATIEKVRSLAVLYETRGKNRANDMAKMLKTLGLEVPNDPKNPRREPNANTRWAAGKGGDGKGKGGKGRDRGGKGKDGKGKGGKGRNRNRCGGTARRRRKCPSIRTNALPASMARSTPTSSATAATSGATSR
jgi:hypothetical protein